MGTSSLRSLLLAAIVLSNCITWTASRHHYRHNVNGHRSRHRRQGAGLFLPASYVIPGGEGSGAWGEWGQISPCSRTCGGGVASQKRICLEFGLDGRPLCTGGDTKYFSCQTHDCPEDAGDFRAEQCAEFNDKLFRDQKIYSWVPYTKGHNPCELNCMPRGERFYYRQREKVIDGTRCNDESFDVCVNGTCQAVGCDMMLGSNAREDKCRECRGNGTNCKTMEGLIDDKELRRGYNDVLLIPQGATNIIIEEMRASSNYLALRAKERTKYYLNGDYHIDFPRSLVIAGAVWHYERNQMGFAAPDKLRCIGPINEPLYLSLLLQEDNVGVKYEYSIPSNLAPRPEMRYDWVFDEFSACSATCGGGIQMRTVTCRSRDDLELVDENLCDGGMKPATNQTCNTQPCPPHWVEGPWSPCSKPCGEGGTRSREVHCEKMITNGVNFRFASIVADQECIGLLGAKPNPYEECNQNATCPTWFTGPWKACDKLCGKGVQTRQVVCHTKVNGRVEVFDDNECADEKPLSEQSCNPQPCKGIDIVLSDWSGCDSCLSKNRIRMAKCVKLAEVDKIPLFISGEVVDYSFCSYHPAPILEEPCDKSKLPPCETQWYATQWSNCSVECGTGVQTRRVFCGMYHEGSVQEVDEARCDPAARYKDTKPCEVPKEKCPSTWYAGPWSNCSVPCGGGEQTRQVICLTGDKVGGACPSGVLATQGCNKMPCNEDEVLPVDSKSTPIMDDVYYDYQDCDDEEEDINQEVGAEVDEQVFPDINYSDVSEGDTGSGLGFTSDEFTTEGSGFETTFETESTSTMETSETSESTTVTDSTITMATGSDGTDASTEESMTESTIVPSTQTMESFGSDNTESAAVDVTESTDTTEVSSTESTNTIETDSTDTSDTDSTTDTNSGSTGATENTESTVTSSTDLTESGMTESSNAEFSSTETTIMETGSTETESTETSATETTESITTESTEISSTESTDATEISSTESTGSTDITETDVTSTTDRISTSTDASTEETTVSSDKDTSATESSTESVTTQTSAETDTSTTENVSDSSYSTTESTSGSSTTESEESSTVLSTTESGASTTGETGETSETTESSSQSTEESTASETVSEVSTISSTDLTESTEFSVTAPTEYTESTTTEATESTGLSTTASTDQTGLTTGFSTSTDWGTTIKALTSTKRHCRPKKIAKCLRSKYGCCKDKRTPASGPFDQGCPAQQTCKETPFKCCSDGVSPAAGPNNEGCPVINCNETLYGCCRSDNTTPAEGNDQEGCPKPLPPCQRSKYGCCADGKTEAKGLKRKGCPEEQKEKPEEKPEKKPEEKPEAKPEGCSATQFGCCADNTTAATGPDGAGCPCNITEFGCCPDGVSPAGGGNMEGCVMACNSSKYGCCPDGQTPAHGPEYEGCCLQTAYGCCPDNYKPAEGPKLEGCGCQVARYGCCPDNKTIARGPDNEGCGCQYTQFGCCPDSHTEAKGPEYEGCDCNTYQFGCCPDGYTIAKGPNLQGCLCQQSKYGCCGDEQTAARGPTQLGCDCSTSKYGCCPDGVTEAKGEKFLNCTNVPEIRQESCALDNDQGPCRNYTVRWYYDAVYGGCSQFWYGGCGGNGNRFASQDECEDVCVRPAPKDACNLPSVKGACNNPTIRWYYNATREQCLQFQYGGCLGNSNNFESRDICQKQCEPASIEDACSLPIERGSCAGSFARWGYSAESGRCEQFAWGGCEGNPNRFASEAACMQRCSPPGVPKPECSLPQASGNCSDTLAVWAFRPSENRCLPFYYTGCDGNDNRFESEAECSRACPSSYEKDTCVLPAETGTCGNYTVRWFFDTSVKQCRQFYYGGCGGNDNNFVTEEQCENRCGPPRSTPPPPAPTRPINNNICFLERDAGPCREFHTRWAYEAARGGCVPFEYGGCRGNANNFDSQDTCEDYCSQIQDVCQLPELAGPCVDWTLSWFYDASIDSCRQFYYGGCEGNDNRFETQEACEQRCRRQEQPRPQLTSTTTTTVAITTTTTTTTTRAPAVPVEVGGSDPCRQPMESGNCMGYTVLWYYDELRQACGQFVYTDCGGNDNRFATEAECEDRCIRRIAPVRPQTTAAPAAPAVTTTTYLPPVQPEREACRAPVSLGPCGENITTFYYDSRTGACLRGDHGACGYPNSYGSEEECERQCGAFRNINDVCRAELDPGPCFYNVEKVYWDAASGRCLPFTYSGCLGGPNRFSSVEECQEVCGGTGPEPACLQAVDSGRGGCGVAVRRWWYDVTAADCRAFVFLGCDGNDNNFVSYEECAARCRPDTIDNEVVPSCQRFDEYCDNLRCTGPVERSRGPDGCVRCECGAAPPEPSPPAPAPAPVDCEPARLACEEMYCNQVLERVIGPDGCEICRCVDPCANTTCAAGERCVHEPYVSAITAVTGELTYLPECRAVNKSGWCPRMAANGTSCERECIDDADCRGVGKCCARGCQASCVVPLPTTVPTVPTTTYIPDIPRAPAANKEETLGSVSAAEGGTATLRCLFHGNPPPSITWRRGEITIESDRERYRLLSDGALEIVSIYRNDSGVYICVGSNSLGSVSQEVHLVVSDPEEGPAGIAGAARSVVRGRLGQPLAVRCLAYGWPVPSIYWYHGRDGPMVPYSSELYEARGNILQIRSLIPEALGEYICQAYNGIGKAAEWSVLVQLDEPDGAPPLTESTTELTTTTTAAPPIGFQISGYTVPVQTRILADRTTVEAGSELTVRCDVDGYPEPDVFWTKDSVRLLPTERITPTEARLTISNANINDSGEYGCHASNAYSSHSASVRITVQGVYIPAKCTDNPFFANCALIVRSRFCNHHYYSRFCCKSCVEAGQLDPQEATMQADEPWKKRK